MPRPEPDALIDRVDNSNRPIGVVRRREVFDERANFRTVHVLVVNRAGELLVQQLAATRERHGSLWGSSVAGYLHPGETYRHAARRRLSEELGLRTSIREVGITPVDDDGVTKFVGVFVTSADAPRIVDPTHIAAVEFRPQSDLQRDLSHDPGAYTDTFRHVLAFWRERERPTRPGRYRDS